MGGSKKLLRWSKRYDRCISCGLATSKHQGHGLCKRCYALKWYLENREKTIIRSRAWQAKRDFGEGNRELVLARSAGKCVRCGKPATEVHHVDHDGVSNVSWVDRWTGTGIGHDPSRMEALCRSCHLGTRYQKSPENK